VGVQARAKAYDDVMQTQKATPSRLEAAVAASSDDSVVRWRMIVLLRAGYAWDDAVEVASATSVDLHLAAELPAKGCPSDTARRILL
jgi:hypothetical protein